MFLLRLLYKLFSFPIKKTTDFKIDEYTLRKILLENELREKIKEFDLYKYDVNSEKYLFNIKKDLFRLEKAYEHMMTQDNEIFNCKD
jgi:hypothetical protein